MSCVAICLAGSRQKRPVYYCKDTKLVSCHSHQTATPDSLYPDGRDVQIVRDLGTFRNALPPLQPDLTCNSSA